MYAYDYMANKADSDLLSIRFCSFTWSGMKGTSQWVVLADAN